MIYLKIGEKRFGKAMNNPAVSFKDENGELLISNLESAVEEAANVLYELGISRTSKMIQSLLMVSDVEEYMEIIKEFDPRISSVEFSEEKRRFQITKDKIILPINSKSSGYLGCVSISGNIDVELALQFIASVDSITSIMEGSILAKRSFEMLKSSLETLSKAMESRVKEAEKFKKIKYKLFDMLIDQFDIDKKAAELSLYVYDVGLIGVKDYILQKDFSKLTNEEVEEYRKHPIYGYEILKNIQDLPKEVLNATLYHHERLDGSGFPYGLKEKDIPYIALFIGFIDEMSRRLSENMDINEIENIAKGKFPDEFVEKLKEVPVNA